MTTQPALVAKQVRLKEWAQQIRDCQNRPKGMEIETLRVCEIQAIKQATQNFEDKNNKIANLILEQKVDGLEKMILERAKQTRRTDIIKKILFE